MEPATEKDDVVTMLDILNDEKELSDQASAVLAGSDEKNCNGFAKRQALYSCLTCAPSDSKTDFSKSIGICLACSLRCHEHHELVELYTKRNFHCDCGIKDGSVSCQLDPAKLVGSQAVRNNYNQNFVGLYCNCSKPYPDPENPTDDEMIQCCICEDWYHSLHLDTTVPAANAYGEMTCAECMKRHKFLADYASLAVTVVEPESEHTDVNIDSSLNGSSHAAGDDEASAPKKAKLAEDICVRPKPSTEGSLKTTFWKEGCRLHLCKCSICIKMYEANKVEFLVDHEDTTHFYEQKGKSNEGPSSYMASLEALSTLPRVNQIDAISSYNRMKEKLFEFLQTFVVNNQIVTEEDIQRFFRSMNESNEQPARQPHFCR